MTPIEDWYDEPERFEVLPTLDATEEAIAVELLASPTDHHLLAWLIRCLSEQNHAMSWDPTITEWAWSPTRHLTASPIALEALRAARAALNGAWVADIGDGIFLLSADEWAAELACRA